MNEKFDFKKSLGQNFLIDNNIVDKIVDSISAKEGDLIFEIGPGAGVLTKKLKNKNCELYAFEIDRRLKDELFLLEDEKTHIIFDDFLNVNIKGILDNKKYNNLYVIGNIPYYITTMIIKKIVTEIKANEVTLMVQKEVADRYMAKFKSRDYGFISVYLQYNFDIESVCFVSKKCFMPVPKVDSEVIKFKRRDKEYVKDEKLFYSFLKDAFSMKRKTLRNNLKNYNFDIVKEYLNKNSLSDTCRAEELSVIDFVNIFNLLN